MKFKLVFVGWRDYILTVMTKVKAHYDGKALVPDEPVDLPVNCELEVQIQVTGQNGSGLADPDHRPQIIDSLVAICLCVLPGTLAILPRPFS